jgi:cell division septation protein DedD
MAQLPVSRVDPVAEVGPARSRPAAVAAVAQAIRRVSVPASAYPRANRLAKRPSMAATGRFVVQLGAFSSEQATRTAWQKVNRKAAWLGGYAPAGAGTRIGAATLYRLTIGGFTNRAEAVRLCLKVRSACGNCFVRGSANERPLRWALEARSDRTA